MAKFRQHVPKIFCTAAKLRLERTVGGICFVQTVTWDVLKHLRTTETPELCENAFWVSSLSTRDKVHTTIR